MKDLTLEPTELNSKVVGKKREKERHNFERLDETRVAREMKMRHCACVCLIRMWVLWERKEKNREI